MPNDAPFKGKLRTSAYCAAIDDADGQVAIIRDPVGVSAPGRTDVIIARRDRIILCVNAYDGLVAIAREYASLGGRVSRGLGSESLEVATQEARDFLHEIGEYDDDPAFDPNKDVMNAVAGRAAKDAGIEVADGN